MSRVYQSQESPILLEPGEYAKDMASGIWWLRPPEIGYAAQFLRDHTIIVHENGEITVSPSLIFHGSHGKIWHGYLIHGEWQKI